MDKVVYKKKVVEQYELRNEGEWAFITLDSNNGLFQSNSSFGNYSYSWTNHGRESFKSFLIEIGYDYFEIVEGAKETYKGVFTYKTTKVTGKGQVYIIDKLLKEVG